MKAQYTPGPWSYGYSGCSGYNIYGSGRHIGGSFLYKKDGGEANARLIAAAPELLDVLQTVVRQCGERLTEASGNTALLDFARAAISRATGDAT